jgi:hypothetical protein
MAHESYIYYEKHKGHGVIEGYSNKTFTIDTEVKGKYILSDSEKLTVVNGYSWNGYVPTEGFGKVLGNAETSLTVQQRMDVSVVPLMKEFIMTRTLNVGLLLLSSGGENCKAQAEATSDLHYFFTYLLAQARIVDMDINRVSGGDVVTMTFKSAGLFFQDHDVEGTLGETSWKNPEANEASFKSIWDEGKAG